MLVEAFMKPYVEKKVSGVIDCHWCYRHVTGVTSSNSNTSDDNTSDKSADKMAYLRWRPQ